MAENKLVFDPTKFESITTGEITTINYDDADAYAKNTDIPLSTLKAVAEYNSAYILAATDTAAELARKTMVKDNSINKVIVSLPFTTSKRGGIDVGIDRVKTYRNPTPGGEPIVKSAISVAVEVPYNRVPKSHIKELEASLTALLVK